MAEKTFMQAVYNSIDEAVENEPGRSQIKGMNKEMLVATVKAITSALDKLPPETNLHVLFFAITYVRNAVAMAMEENSRTLATQTGGNA